MRGRTLDPFARLPALLGVDLAGGSMTSVVTDMTGRVLAKAETQVQLRRPRPGWVEADPLDWLAAAIVTIRRAVHGAGVLPQAIGISGQMYGLVLVDASGRPVRPAVLWPDVRAVSQLGAFRELPDQVRGRLLNPLTPAMAGPTLCWIAAREPDSYARTRWALQPKDWLRAQLTGEYFSEPSDASATLLYDLMDNRWSDDTVHSLGLDRGRLPEVLPGAGYQAGLLTLQGANLIGLRPGTPVAAGAARTAAAALDMGRADTNAAQIVIGSTTHVIASVPALPPSLPPTVETHVYRAATDHGWYVMAQIADSCGPLAAIRKASGAAQNGHAMTGYGPRSSCSAASLMRNGIQAVSRSPDARDQLSPALRRLAINIAAAVRSIAALAPISQLQIAGVGGTHPGLLTMLADLVGQPLHAVQPPVPAARNAALLAARAAGLLDEETLLAQLVRTRSPIIETRYPDGRRC